MDRVLSRFGLHGKSFVPLVTGFGCTIPAIMATRSVRFAIDVSGGPQIVPGVGVPLQVDGNDVEVMALGYLSFKHGAWE
jgi:hypothetical protein